MPKLLKKLCYRCATYPINPDDYTGQLCRTCGVEQRLRQFRAHLEYSSYTINDGYYGFIKPFNG